MARRDRIVRTGHRHDVVTVVAIVVLAGLVFYLFWLQPRRRQRAGLEALERAVVAFEAGDCETAATRIEQARANLRDTLPERQQEIERRCKALLDAPEGGVSHFLDRATESVCAGGPPTVIDPLEGTYGPEFFALIDSTASGFWGDAALRDAPPAERRAARVADFRFALCHTVVGSRPLDRCPFTLLRAGEPHTVYLTRAIERWSVRAVDLTTLRTVARREFTTSPPGACDEYEALLNTPVHVATGSIDVGALQSWLEGIPRRRR